MARSTLLCAFIALGLAWTGTVGAQDEPTPAESAEGGENQATEGIEENVGLRFEPSPYRIQHVHLPPGVRGPQAGVSRGRYIVNFGTRDGVQPGSIFKVLYKGELMGLLKTTRAWRDTTELTLVRLVNKSDIESPYPLNPGYYLEPQLVLLETIQFEAGEPVIDPDMYERLRYAARFVRSFPQCPLVIEGHTDSNGKASDNMRLSQQRAEGVRLFLNEVFRIPNDQLHAIGYGESRPTASNSTADGRYKNRRVDIVLMDKLPNKTPANGAK
jgi:outer membrane protein OmpA-like peptidoglycan-associated protein